MGGNHTFTLPCIRNCLIVSYCVTIRQVSFGDRMKRLIEQHTILIAAEDGDDEKEDDFPCHYY